MVFPIQALQFMHITWSLAFETVSLIQQIFRLVKLLNIVVLIHTFSHCIHPTNRPNTDVNGPHDHPITTKTLVGPIGCGIDTACLRLGLYKEDN